MEASGINVVVLDGKGFTGVDTVEVAGVSSSFNVLSDTGIMVIVDADLLVGPSTAEIIVRRQADFVNGFLVVTAAGPPDLVPVHHSFDPASVAVSTGVVTVKLLGESLSGVDTVVVTTDGPSVAVPFTVISDSELDFELDTDLLVGLTETWVSARDGTNSTTGILPVTP
jgi:hypothetical protein